VRRLRTDFSLSALFRLNVFGDYFINSLRVGRDRKNAMAISKGRKKRIIRENFLTEVSRNSTFMNSPNPTVGDNTPTERTKTANLYYSDEISST